MTGGEHYREAERLLSNASFTRGITKEPTDRDGMPISAARVASLIARADVHATLAVAAALVDDKWGREQVLGRPEVQP